MKPTTRATARWAATATALVAALAPLAVTAPADAGVNGSNDRRADVWKKVPGDGETPATVVALNRSLPNADLDSFRVTYEGRRLSYVATYHDLAPTDDRVITIANFRIPEQQPLRSHVDFGPDSREGTSRLFTRNGDVPCRMLSHSVNYAKDTVTLSIPRVCIDGAPFVKWQAMSTRIKPRPGDTYDLFYDDARTNGAVPDTFSARVYR